MAVRTQPQQQQDPPPKPKSPGSTEDLHEKVKKKNNESRYPGGLRG
jgi:hypothetical protein